MSAEAFLIDEKVVPLKRSALDGVDVMAGIDRGCSLTKVLFVTAGDSADTYNLHFALFNNKHFEAGLAYLASKAILRNESGGEGSTKSGKIHVTGVGCDKYRVLIQEKLGVELVFIDEFLSQTRGTHWLIGNIPHDQLCYPDVDVDLSLFTNKSDNPIQDKLQQQFQVKPKEEAEGSFPCLACFVGSGGGVIYIKESGESYMLSGLWLAGKSFLGFGKMLLGTSNYDEILELATKGRRGNIDNEGRDLMLTDVDGPYGNLPASLPIFPFGKAVDLELDREKCSKADLAQSLVAAFVTNIFNLLSTTARMSETNIVYLGGNFFRHPFMRQEMLRQQHFFDMKSLKLRYLITGHTGAVGAMVSEPSDAMKYLRFGRPN